MQLTVLTDNNTYIDQYYLGEPAVSYFIEDDGKHILFDTGYSSVFLDNAKAMGIDLKKTDVLALSHGHDDHTGGLAWLFDTVSDHVVELVAHPLVFDEKEIEGLSICSPFRKREMASKCRMRLSEKPVKISSHITFLGQIPSLFPFEERKKIGKRREEGGEWQDDYVDDDSALVCQSERGISIITGCSHSGICNIIEYARQVCGCDRVLSVIGGFHLPELDERAKKTIEFLEGLRLETAYPCHCTSFSVRAAMSLKIPVKEVGVGLQFNW